LTLYPGAGESPLTSTINFQNGRTKANNASVTLGDGGLNVYAAAPTHVIVDIVGYFQ
jgi:hypothetical protein